MSNPEHRTRENGCELEPYTNWPLILGAAAFVVVGVGAVGTMAGVTAVTAAPKAVYRWITQADAPVARAAPTPEPGIVAPAPVPVVEEQEPPMRSVVVEHVEILGKPRVETAASLALERMTVDRAAPKKAPRLDLASLHETQLEDMLLARSKELDIGNEKDLLETLVGGAKDRLAEAKRDSTLMSDTEASYRTISALVAKRSDLLGLPLVDMEDCTLSTGESKALSMVSREKRTNRGDPKSSHPRERHGSTATIEGGPLGVLMQYRSSTGASRGRLIEVSEDIVRPLLQVYEVQPEESRLALAGVIAKSKSGRSARALVRLAVFDLSERVREEAVKHLPSQDAKLVRAELLAAFRHPWTPAAVHAAKAADLLDDKDMIPSLKKLLDQPDPNKPFQKKGTWYVRELVRVNHLKNCLLCHPPAGAERPTLSGPVPLRDREIPLFYYASREKGVTLVNASTVYLRQDFSVLHSVDGAKPWPELQRFDYLVRTRELRGDEIPKKAEKHDPETFTYPQREAARALLDVLVQREPRAEPRPESVAPKPASEGR